MRSTTISLATLTVLFAAVCQPVHAVPLTAGNIIVNDFVGPPTGRLREFTQTGTLVQTFNYPIPGSGTESARGVVVDTTGKVQIYNGTFSPVLTTLNPATGTSVNNPGPVGWSTVNNFTFGGMAAFGNFVFATDTFTAGAGAPFGLIQFDIGTFAGTRFANGPTFGDYIQVTVGLDNLLYGQRGSGSPAGNQIDVFCPTTLAFIRTIDLGFVSRRSIAVDTNGDIFAVDCCGTTQIFRYSTAGTLINTASPGLGAFTNIDIDPTGKLVISGNGSGTVVVTDRNLATFSNFNAGSLGLHNFVAFVKPVPSTATCPSGAGVTVTQSGGSTAITEGGTTDTYTVVLNTAPTANVTITIAPGTQATVAPATLTFTPANWNTAQTVTVTAVDDALVEGPHTATINHTASSTDTAYNGVAIASVTANITDNDAGPPPPPPPPTKPGAEGTYGTGTGAASPEGSFADAGRASQPALRGPFATGPGHQEVLNVSGTQPRIEAGQAPAWAVVALALLGLVAVLSGMKVVRTLIGAWRG